MLLNPFEWSGGQDALMAGRPVGSLVRATRWAPPDSRKAGAPRRTQTRPLGPSWGRMWPKTGHLRDFSGLAATSAVRARAVSMRESRLQAIV